MSYKGWIRTFERLTAIRTDVSSLKWIVLAIVFGCLFTIKTTATSPKESQLFTYNELIELYQQETLDHLLREKLNDLLTTPFVSNEATARGAKPLMPNSDRLGKVLRVVHWNIERGLEYEAIEAAFKDGEAFSGLLDKSMYPEGSDKRQSVLEQAALLREADCIVLNEVDWGLKRTEYRNVVSELAKNLNMNYAYGVEFVEVDPIALGIESFDEAEPEDQVELIGEIKVDPDRYKGMHGTAILSRYPLHNVRLIPFKFQAHDWYVAEKKGASKVEQGKRKAGELVFLEKAQREVRRGGRMMLLADLVDPQLPGGRVTVVATHLEDRTKPSNRVRQLEELLAAVSSTRHAVIIAGDMNTSTQNMTPTSVSREIKKRLGSKSFWIKRGITYVTGAGLPFELVGGGLNKYRTQGDPTVRHIPLIAPNNEAKFFQVLKHFRFADGGAFDFRGDRNRSAGNHDANLANSNERGDKGFVTTFEVERKVGFIGKFKLDWLFVKPPTQFGAHSFRFAPHFGRTLKTLNRSVGNGISDHDPIVVDLPFDEPKLIGRGDADQ
jgi:endonuclease/exonuclease/phosphatase family metal-dependent hydrolase